MENWGDTYLLVDKKETSARVFRRPVSIFVHELAQWFGNLVSMKFWDGLWLNESFADLAELHAWETLDPSWCMWQDYAIRWYEDGLVLDKTRSVHQSKCYSIKRQKLHGFLTSLTTKDVLLSE
jgi:aminopeptidase 2